MHTFARYRHDRRRRVRDNSPRERKIAVRDRKDFCPDDCFCPTRSHRRDHSFFDAFFRLVILSDEKYSRKIKNSFEVRYERCKTGIACSRR